MGYNGSLANLQGIYDVMTFGSPLNLSGDAFSHYRNLAGFKNNISTTVLDDMSLVPSTTSLPTPNGIQLKVFSSTTTDALSGIGAQRVELHYLDTDYLEKSEVITMNGTTPVNTVATNIHRIQQFYVTQVGSNNIPTGNISITNIAGNVTYDYISGANQSLRVAYTIPEGYYGFITSWFASSTKQAVNIYLRATVSRYDRSYTSGVFLIQDMATLNSSTTGRVLFEYPLKCPSRTDIKISATGAVGGADVSGAFGILLIPINTYQ